MITLAALTTLALVRRDAVADQRLAKLRAAYAAVQSATVQSAFTKVDEGPTSPGVAISTVTYFQRPNRIRCLATRRGQSAPFLTYVTDGKTFRRTEDGEVTTGDFTTGETLPSAGVALEVLALWAGDTLLRAGSRVLPHPLTGSATTVTGPDGRRNWGLIAMNDDRILLLIDPKTGLLGDIRVGTVQDRLTGLTVSRYEFQVERWNLGVRFPKDFFRVPGKEKEGQEPPPPGERS